MAIESGQRRLHIVVLENVLRPRRAGGAGLEASTSAIQGDPVLDDTRASHAELVRIAV